MGLGIIFSNYLALSISFVWITAGEQYLTRKREAIAMNSQKRCITQSQLWQQKTPQSNGRRIPTVTVLQKNC